MNVQAGISRLIAGKVPTFILKKERARQRQRHREHRVDLWETPEPKKADGRISAMPILAASFYFQSLRDGS
jgi:hypothetical protein